MLLGAALGTLAQPWRDREIHTHVKNSRCRVLALPRTEPLHAALTELLLSC